MLNFCTLFDINYATQGLVMYESLEKCCDDFHLYIFAFCNESFELLTNLNLEKVTVVSLKEFEDEELLRIKPTRSQCEYCWTCSSSTIKYCLEKFQLDSCTYIDADLYFYSNPKVLVDEMGDKSVLITEHRYTPKYEQSKTSGKYCVQFITFKNDENGLRVLNWWRNACLEWCFAKMEDGKFGDQKYLDDWTERFEGIHELQHLGGGAAPWNVHQYQVFVKNGKIYLDEDKTSNVFELVFYHFHSVKILKNGKLDMEKYNFYNIGRFKQKTIYTSYLKNLEILSKKLHILNKNIIIVKRPIFNLNFKSNFKLKFKAIRKWIFSFRLSKKGRFLKFMGIYLIKPPTD